MAADTQAIKDKLDIVDFIGEYVQLKPSGTNHKGLCPFHHEKSPSFMVHRDRQFWHCFGCAKGGDIFTFVQEMEGMDFPEALKFLADKAGIPLETFKIEIGGSQRNRLKDIVAESARFFHNFLLKIPGAEAARVYVKGRGLSADTIEEWKIGYAPEQWDLLTQYLLKKGFGIDDLVAAGVTIAREGADRRSGRGFYDRFRGRVMFPICDIHGAVVGFTGRVLVETEHSGGKYINTPQTLLYDKSSIVFGLNKAKQEIKNKNLIVMVEGQMDVIACHQAGMKNVVATSGTAFTLEQVKLLKRYSSNISIAFDADAAGQAAAKRGIDVALEEGMNIKVIRIPEGKGKDADECLKKNPDVWLQAVEKAEQIMEWYITGALKNKSLTDPRQKQLAADEVLPNIARIPFAVERDHWLRQLAVRLGVDVSVLLEDMKRWQKKEQKPAIQPASQSAAETPVTLTRIHTLINRLLALFLKFPSASPALAKIPDNALSTSLSPGLYEALKVQYTTNHLIHGNSLREVLDKNNQTIIDILTLQGEKDFSDFKEADAQKEAVVLLQMVQGEWFKQRRAELQKEISMAEQLGNRERLETLLKEFQQLSAS